MNAIILNKITYFMILKTIQIFISLLCFVRGRRKIILTYTNYDKNLFSVNYNNIYESSSIRKKPIKWFKIVKELYERC